MNNPFLIDFNKPELGTLEDLVVALREEELRNASETTAAALVMEDYLDIALEVSGQKNTPGLIRH